MEGSWQNWGITRRAFQEVFEGISDRSGTYSYEISVSIVEVYNETVRDLLNGSRVEIMENS